MPRFIGSRDLNYIHNITKELVQDVVDITVDIFKIDKEQTQVDIYGENVNGYIYRPYYSIQCMIAREEEATTNDEFGLNREQGVKFSFHRVVLEEVNVFPEEGDIIYFNGKYNEIMSIIDNQLIGGQSNKINKHSIICNTKTVSRKKINLMEV